MNDYQRTVEVAVTLLDCGEPKRKRRIGRGGIAVGTEAAAHLLENAPGHHAIRQNGKRVARLVNQPARRNLDELRGLYLEEFSGGRRTPGADFRFDGIREVA